MGGMNYEGAMSSLIQKGRRVPVLGKWKGESGSLLAEVFLKPTSLVSSKLSMQVQNCPSLTSNLSHQGKATLGNTYKVVVSS